MSGRAGCGRIGAGLNVRLGATQQRHRRRRGQETLEYDRIAHDADS